MFHSGPEALVTRKSSRWWRGVAAAAVMAGAAVVLSASPASAISNTLPPPVWENTWKYSSSTAFSFTVSLPGVRFAGTGTDSPSGARTITATVTDTADDGRCAGVNPATDAVGVTFGGIKETCGGGTSVTFSTVSFTGNFKGKVFTRPAGGNVYGLLSFYIPASSTDPELRTTGTGAGWWYNTTTNFDYYAIRPGAKLTGYGTDGLNNGPRSTTTTVTSTAATRCARGTLNNASEIQSTGWLCSPATTVTLTHSFVGGINPSAELHVVACAVGQSSYVVLARCVEAWIPDVNGQF